MGIECDTGMGSTRIASVKKQPKFLDVILFGLKKNCKTIDEAWAEFNRTYYHHYDRKKYHQQRRRLIVEMACLDIFEEDFSLNVIDEENDTCRPAVVIKKQNLEEYYLKNYFSGYEIIEIDVKGTHGTGKSVILGVISSILKEKGLDVSTPEDFQNLTEREQKRALDSILSRENLKVVLNEQNVMRSSYS